MKKKIRAVFFDIDGTLVSFNTHKVPQSAIDAIRSIREQGAIVFIATGRPLPFINNLGGLAVDGIMCVNGAYCFASDGTEICKHPVSQDDIERLILNQQEHPMMITFAGNHDVFSVNPFAGKLPDDAALTDALNRRQEVEEVFTLLNLQMPEIRPIEAARDMEVMQVIAFFSKDEERHLMSDVMQGLDANRWHGSFADCIAKGCNKATGIDAVIRHYGISLSETMAFGDGGNDIEMLAHAGVGVAMGNASDEVKSHADVITSSVDDDGVARILMSDDYLFCK